jgi:oligopeptide/dipeptide ABC transporter ATP-binding protein
MPRPIEPDRRGRARHTQTESDKLMLLTVENLTVDFETPDGRHPAVEQVGFHVAAGETVGLVGESGCGKSVTALSILGLLTHPPARVTAGRIRFAGEDVRDMDAERLRRIRGREMAMIFQEPMTSLNPVLTIGRQVAEPLMAHRGMARGSALAEAERWLENVQLPNARSRLSDYPHQLSGGMRQRVMIAMAMVCHPKLLIADEPTTALDVTLQAQILALMLRLKAELQMSMLLISHDMGVIAQTVQRVIVMYAGRVVETAAVTTLFERAFHPYTAALLQTVPRFCAGQQNARQRLAPIAGRVPRWPDALSGCKFNPRCPHAFDLCRHEEPALLPVGKGHSARCWLQRFSAQRRDDV